MLVQTNKSSMLVQYLCNELFAATECEQYDVLPSHTTHDNFIWCMDVQWYSGWVEVLVETVCSIYLSLNSHNSVSLANVWFSQQEFQCQMHFCWMWWMELLWYMLDIVSALEIYLDPRSLVNTPHDFVAWGLGWTHGYQSQSNLLLGLCWMRLKSMWDD